MFKHEDAPFCQKGTFCRAKICQFKHNTVVENQIEAGITEEQSDVDRLSDWYPCNICDFVSKTEAYLSVHMLKHKPAECHNKDLVDGSNTEEDEDDEDEDDDGPMDCNHCLINGVKPGFVTEDFEVLLQHIWTDHKENSAWGPAH